MPTDPNMQNGSFSNSLNNAQGFYTINNTTISIPSWTSGGTNFSGSSNCMRAMKGFTSYAIQPTLGNNTQIYGSGICSLYQNVYLPKGSYTLSYYATGLTNGQTMTINIGPSISSTITFDGTNQYTSVGKREYKFSIPTSQTYEIKFSHSTSSSNVFLLCNVSLT